MQNLPTHPQSGLTRFDPKTGLPLTSYKREFDTGGGIATVEVDAGKVQKAKEEQAQAIKTDRLLMFIKPILKKVPDITNPSSYPSGWLEVWLTRKRIKEAVGKAMGEKVVSKAVTYKEAKGLFQDRLKNLQSEYNEKLRATLDFVASEGDVPPAAEPVVWTHEKALSALKNRMTIINEILSLDTDSLDVGRMTAEIAKEQNDKLDKEIATLKKKLDLNLLDRRFCLFDPRGNPTEFLPDLIVEVFKTAVGINNGIPCSPLDFRTLKEGDELLEIWHKIQI